MENGSAVDDIDSLEVLRQQLETSMSLAFDLDFDVDVRTGQNAPVDTQLQVDNDVGSETNCRSSSSYDIVQLAASPSSHRRRTRQSEQGKQTVTSADRDNDEVGNNNNNKVNIEIHVEHIDNEMGEQPKSASSDVDCDESLQEPQQVRHHIDGNFYSNIDIVQLEASPVVIRPKFDNKCKEKPVSSEHLLSVTMETETASDGEMPNSSCIDGDNDDETDEIDAIGIKNLESSPVKLRPKQPTRTAERPLMPIKATNLMQVAPLNRPLKVETAYENRVKELARRIDEEAVNNTSNSSTHEGQTDRRMSNCRIGGVRRRDDQRSSNLDTEDYQLTDAERQWIVASACSDYQLMSRLLHGTKSLAARRDPITGRTALHWAAKNGRDDVIKLLQGSTAKPPIDCRTRDAGHTPLHLAAMHGRHGVIELLTVVYKADCNAIDFAGRLPVHYLLQFKKAMTGKGVDSTSTEWLRSEALLKPSRSYVKPDDEIAIETNSTVPEATMSRRQSFWSTLTGNNTAPTGNSASGRDSMPTITRGLTVLAQSTSTAALPPRQLPMVAQRQSVITLKVPDLLPSVSRSPVSKVKPPEPSHSDNEESSSEDRRQLNTLRSCGSVPNFESLV